MEAALVINELSLKRLAAPVYAEVPTPSRVALRVTKDLASVSGL